MVKRRPAPVEPEVPKLALRPDKRGDLDDVVVEGVRMFRMECMDRGREWWLACYLTNGESVVWWITGKNLRVKTTETPEHFQDWDLTP